MSRIICIIAVAFVGLFLGATTKAKEVQFSTLPEVVRTTVFHHYNLPGPEKVVRVVEEPNAIYEITIVTDSGNQVVYVDEEGNIVQRPAGAEETQGESESTYVTVTTDEIESGGDRYVFVEDQGPDAIYIDHQTNKKVVLKGGAGKEPRGDVRTKERGQTDVQTQEKSRSEGRTNEQNKSGVQTDQRDQQPGATPRETAEGQTNDQNKSGVRTDQKNQQPGATPRETAEGQTNDQNKNRIRTDQKNQQPGATPKKTEPGNVEQKNTREEQRTQPQGTEQGQDQRQKQQRETNRTPGGQQETQERTKGKEKASPTP
ncbi:MAG: hypothetical protein JO308_18555 [Verrucomicrobia bacterium]|nr:hypothetical protein [Verrucomicrobiota bacterium]